MDSCEEGVTIAFGLYLISEEEKREKRKQFHTQNFPLGGRGMALSQYNLFDFKNYVIRIML
jgi:hypothetical protein